jgi:hypothetical protein
MQEALLRLAFTFTFFISSTAIARKLGQSKYCIGSLDSSLFFLFEYRNDQKPCVVALDRTLLLIRKEKRNGFSIALLSPRPLPHAMVEADFQLQLLSFPPIVRCLVLLWKTELAGSLAYLLCLCFSDRETIFLNSPADEGHDDPRVASLLDPGFARFCSFAIVF